MGLLAKYCGGENRHHVETSVFGPLYLSLKKDWLELFPERLCMMLPSHSEVFKVKVLDVVDAASLYTVISTN